MTLAQRIIRGALLIAVVAAIVYLEQHRPPRLSGDFGEEIQQPKEIVVSREQDIQHKVALYPRAKEITLPAGFLNGENISIGEFVGKKIILVDFWTYSCINCQRTIPYLNAWYGKYKDKGLEIIGVHTPEFEFEKKSENVQQAIERFAIRYPVVLDNDYGTWIAYNNQYWPHKYLIDIDGFVVYDHIGEGAYEETERKIQELLRERSEVFAIGEEIEPEIALPAGVEEVRQFSSRSPEVYFGSFRNNFLANGKSSTSGIQEFVEPVSPRTNLLYLAGIWNIGGEFAESQTENAKIIFRYRAQKVFFVAGAEKGVKIRVLRDGKPLDAAVLGKDIDENSEVFIQENRLYRLIEDLSGPNEHTMEIIIENPGLRVFTFTFG